MNPNDSINKIADTAHATTDTVANKAERSVESARHYANEALDKADAKVRSLREDVQPAIDAISARVHDMADTARTRAAETADLSKEKLHDVANRTSAYVQQQPLKSMAIAAAAGAVLAMLMGRRR